jgi:hypothetical protein
MERKVHDHVHNSLPLVHTARHINLVHIILSYFINTHFNIIFQHACLPMCIFLSGIPTKFRMHLFTLSYIPICLILKNILVNLINKRLLTI